MKIALASDERVSLLAVIQTYLANKKIEVVNFFPEKAGATLYFPDVAISAAQTVIEQRCDEAILLCWTGTGVCIAANKIAGIRAALCTDAETAKGARRWNNANVLCLSTRLTSAPLAKEILASWFTSYYIANPVDDACIAKLHALDKKRQHP
jgi:ribose 5-phosphate isomerase B